jgi:RHS repeat-associated protein
MRVSTIRTGTTATPGLSQHLALTYDLASNVTSVADSAGTAETVIYTPDSLDRLTGATGFTGGLIASYFYNTIGNMETKKEGASDLKLCYPAAGLARPHAVTSVYNSGTATCGAGTPWMTLGYDANGNLQTQTQGGTTTNYLYDAENRLIQRNVVGGSQTVHSYDSNGTPLTRSAPATGAWTMYLEGIYEKTNTGAIKKYYMAFGRAVAMRDVPTGSGAGTLYYLLADHLGGTVEVLNSTGGTVSETKYWPYGATRTPGVTQTDKLFTGQRQEPGDNALGLYNYNLRFYGTTLGRFASADPFAQRPPTPADDEGSKRSLIVDMARLASVSPGDTPGTPLNLQRYTYSASNPYAL